MKARRWSFTGLEQSRNCLKQFDEVRNKKRFPYEATSVEAVWGRYAHKAFEDRQGTRVTLPQDLAHHEKFMKRMEAWAGDYFQTEMQVALDAKLKPCPFFGGDAVWWSGIIDYLKVDAPAHRARIVDYKTGKRKPKPEQLEENALWVWAQYPEVDVIDSFFYWTQAVDKDDDDAAIDRYVFSRKQIPELWAHAVPALKKLLEAYTNNVWPAKKSGLCGWCPVCDCEHWWDHNVGGPKR